MHGVLFGAKQIKGMKHSFLTYNSYYLVNRAKIPERNKVGFGNIPWQDEDGLMAKEAMYTDDRSRPVSKPIDDAQPLEPIPQRALTTYDDL
jgi:hypothetical protein